MGIAGEPIEAILKLNTQPFRKDLNGVFTAVTKFKESMVDIGTDSVKVSNGVNQLNRSLTSTIPSLKIFTELSAGIKNFNTFANGVLRLSEAMTTLGNTSQVNSMSIIRFKEIVDSLEGSFGRLNNNVARYNNLSNNIINASNNSSSSLKQMQQDLLNMGKGVQPLARVREQMDMMKTEFNQARSNMLQFANGGVEAFNKIDATSNKVKAQFNQMVAELEMLAWTGVEAFNKIETGEAKLLSSHQRENSALQQVIASDERLAGLKQQLAQSYNQESASSDRATASMKRQESASKTLKNSLGMLRNAVTLVGSMIAYNFIHNLGQATNETINAKSEMNGYFQMLGYTTRQTEDFNKALEDTVTKFPRLNKYTLGETISSIGVEFELSTKEMKKAMPVVSMITSEYLRAGRNVNEASLAVKDILQGEFQRLSRETGVKGDQLKEAGWSGDKNDVMGLLEALDKVGKSRNWDTFVVKANSLNDAVLILQNRFSEWSADMVERIQPTIVGAFNTIMSVAELFSRVINGVADWLGSEGIGQSIVKWGGLVTTLGAVSVALIKYRTGANLTQIAQMGLTKSIGATILGLEGELVAEHGLIDSFLLTNTSIDANTLKNKGRLNSITAVITGLEAETVAEKGKLKSLTASLLGLDMATFKEYGFATALGVATTQIEAKTFASYGLITQIALISATTLPAIAVIGAFSVAFGNLVMETMNATSNMKNFYDIQQNGKKYVDDAKDSVKMLNEKQKELTKTQKQYTKGSDEYKNVGLALDDLNDKLSIAKQNIKDNYEALQIVNSAQNNYDTGKQEAQLELQRRINQSLVDTGLSLEEANELSNTYLNQAIDGSQQLYEGLQSVVNQYDKQADGVASLTEYWSNQGLDANQIKLKVDPYIDAQTELAGDIEKMKLSSDVIEVASTWIKVQMDQWSVSWSENLPKIEAGDWVGGLSGLAKGLAHFFADLPIFSDFWGWVWKQTGIDKLENDEHTPIERLTIVGQNLGKWIIDSTITGIGVSAGKAFADFLEHPFESMGIDFSNYDIIGSFLDNILSPVSASDGSSSSGGHDYVAEFFDDPRITGFTDGIKSWVDGIPTMIKDTALNVGMSIVDFVTSLFSTDTNGIETWVQDNIITPLVNSVEQGVLNTPVLGDIAKFLGFGENPEQEAQNTGNQIGTGISQGTQQGLLPIPNIFNDAFGSFDMSGILSKFTTNTSTMTSNAQSTATNVATAFTTMKNNHKASVDSMVNKNTTAFNDMYNKSHNSMLQMRDSTSNVTSQMTNAWRLMKDNIVASANRIKTDSESRFNGLGKTIGGFYHKLQNPSLWGSGAGVRTYSRNPRPSVARSLFNTGGSRGGYHGAGYNPYKSSSNTTMPIKDLMKMMANVDEDVNVSDFLSLFTGGFGGWDFVKPHTDKIKSTSDLWKSASANIQGIGSVGDGYLVKRFNDGTPKFTWSEFLSTAQGIFSAIPYKFYYDSEWKGNWVNALLSGATNCSDGSDALIALASVFGFSGSKVHTTLKDGVGHFYAVINGHKMDTTHFQNSGSWSPLGGAGIPTRTSKGAGSSNNSKTVNITVDMRGSTIYGVDDLDDRIKGATKEAMREEFNDPFSVAI